MTLDAHVRTLGRGPGRSRSLTLDEANEAMRIILNGDAAPEAIGALLMLLRTKGETADEIAGFAQAAQEAAPELPQVDLDWPSYAAGHTRGLPWFLLSAKLIADAGYTVLLHGFNGTDATVRNGIAQAGIGVAETRSAVTHLLERDRIAYLPLETWHPALFEMLKLRDVLGLRSCINTVCRMLNPARARASVQGVFHPSYRLLQADAAARLGWHSLSVIKGGGGEFERHPAKDIAGFGLRNGAHWETTFPALCDETRRLAEFENPTPGIAHFPNPQNGFETAIVTGTTALALDTLGVADSQTHADTLWAERVKARAA
ncbi:MULTISPECIES: glycosyl transferase family protein [Marivita]|jgi:anthranilate phosphoribosyltransferase|uniref:Glycosyl transferase family protein n=1 Tax=Marivita cryptomonadis TaxID=505252 RepID=A0A9Q2PG50_9RHOB|nr:MULTISPECIES: glycosyl transferase family protein [Marivita]MCR9170382.1 glycosyl transferase family protein [Paracoccaceae bacterium]MBM2324219.1 glycosyl transferase family protein [Marivita cryptomonadis]MBM2333803.1 glycosyl transferase family protein [Marivita cryptomonadis]MBM2343385.1 glycosyl transferase family protein [Marivita cryptomonadis]MBM2348052.1 glycosyl transferase family protein [Marivita cryptomonadis]